MCGELLISAGNQQFGIIKEVGSPVFTKVGAGGETTIEFTPVSPGQSSIDLRYLPPGAAPTTQALKVFSISVTVKG